MKASTANLLLGFRNGYYFFFLILIFLLKSSKKLQEISGRDGVSYGDLDSPLAQVSLRLEVSAKPSLLPFCSQVTPFPIQA